MIKVFAINLFLIAVILIGFNWYYELQEPPAIVRVQGHDSLDVSGAEPDDVGLEAGPSSQRLQWRIPTEERIRQFAKNPPEGVFFETNYGYFEDHPVFTYRPEANSASLVREFYNGKLIYDVSYIFDRFHRRVTPYNGNPEDPDKKFALFFGGSFTMGDGVDQNQTLPFYFSDLSRTTDFVPYNYGFQGYGPQHMLLQLQHSAVEQQVAQKSGVAFFHYLTFQRLRLQGTMKALRGIDGRLPYVDYDENGLLQHVGHFYEVRPFYYQFLMWLNKFALARNLFYDIPGVSWPGVLEKMCDLLSQSKDLLESKFDAVEFVVIVSYYTRSSDDLVEKCLRPRGIRYVDLANKWSKKQRTEFVLSAPSNLHYSSEGNRNLAEDIIKGLGL